MKALFMFFCRARKPHNDQLRANQFDNVHSFSPYLAMLPGDPSPADCLGIGGTIQPARRRKRGGSL